ncbi:unnamed protein product, partial [Ectocarpus sp. 12 AP-2014]
EAENDRLTWGSRLVQRVEQLDSSLYASQFSPVLLRSTAVLRTDTLEDPDKRENMSKLRSGAYVFTHQTEPHLVKCSIRLIQQPLNGVSGFRRSGAHAVASANRARDRVVLPPARLHQSPYRSLVPSFTRFRRKNLSEAKDQEKTSGGDWWQKLRYNTSGRRDATSV